MHDRIHLQEVSPSVVAVVDERFVSNVAAVIFSEFIVVVDAGMSAYAAHILRETLEELYSRPVRYVVVTHHHMDHVGGLEAFSDVAIVGSKAVAQRLRDLPEWARAERQAVLQNDPAGTSESNGDELRMPSLLFDDGIAIADETTGIGGLLELYHSGGHTSCSSWAYLAQERVLLAGDLVVAGEFPFAGDETADPEVWMNVLRGWQEMDIERVVPGHGPVSGADEIIRQLEFLETLKGNVLDAVSAGGGQDQVLVPDIIPVAEGHQWFVDSTLKRWHSYYADSAGLTLSSDIG